MVIFYEIIWNIEPTIWLNYCFQSSNLTAQVSLHLQKNKSILNKEKSEDKCVTLITVMICMYLRTPLSHTHLNLLLLCSTICRKTSSCFSFLIQPILSKKSKEYSKLKYKGLLNLKWFIIQPKKTFWLSWETIMKTYQEIDYNSYVFKCLLFL